MPGRKSNVSTTSVGSEEVPEGTPSAQSKASKEKEGFSVDDLSLPKSMVARLAKGVLPANTQIHKDALLALHKSATVFVNFIASNSNDNAQAAGKKTIAPQDVMAALKDSEYETFLPRLEAELKKYNETQCDKRNTYRRKVKADKDAAVGKEGGDASEIADGSEAAAAAHVNGDLARDVEGDADRPAKKLKGDHGTAVTPGADDDMADDDNDEDQQEGNDQDEDSEEDGVDDEVPEEEESEDNRPMEDALEEQEDDASGIRDEALDDPDSD